MGKVHEVAGDDGRVRMTVAALLESLAELIEVEKARSLRIDLPCLGIRISVVVLVHLLIHPDRVADMDDQRHSKLAAFLEESVETRVVHMGGRSGLSCLESGEIGIAEALVADFADSPRSLLEVTYEGSDCLFFELRGAPCAHVKATPHFKCI